MAIDMNLWRWLDRASCRGLDLVLFFGPVGERQADKDLREPRAKLICEGCPVRRQCLDAAIERNEKSGVFGGLGEDERALERRRRMRRVNAA